MSVGVVLLLCSLSRMIEPDFPLWPMTYLVSDCWPLERGHICVLSHGVDLESNLKTKVFSLMAFVPLSHQCILKTVCCSRSVEGFLAR